LNTELQNLQRGNIQDQAQILGLQRQLMENEHVMQQLQQEAAQIVHTGVHTLNTRNAELTAKNAELNAYEIELTQARQNLKNCETLTEDFNEQFAAMERDLEAAQNYREGAERTLVHTKEDVGNLNTQIQTLSEQHQEMLKKLEQAAETAMHFKNIALKRSAEKVYKKASTKRKRARRRQKELGDEAPIIPSIEVQPEPEVRSGNGIPPLKYSKRGKGATDPPISSGSIVSDSMHNSTTLAPRPPPQPLPPHTQKPIPLY